MTLKEISFQMSKLTEEGAMPRRDNVINFLAERIADQRAQILDEFLITYCAARNIKAKQISKLKVIFKHNPDGSTETWFELRRGKEKQNGK